VEVLSLAPERVQKGFSGPRPRIHHVACVVPPTEIADLRSSLETTLHDASAALGHDIEIHVESEGLRDFFEMVRAGADGWDGSEPLRPVET
jgi:hypothetical protein